MCIFHACAGDVVPVKMSCNQLENRETWQGMLHLSSLAKVYLNLNSTHLLLVNMFS